MPVSILIPAALRPYVGGQPAVEVDGRTVADALAQLIARHPDLGRHLRGADGRLRSFVNVYVGEEDIRFLAGEATEVPAGVELSIVPSIAGGAADLPDLPNLPDLEPAEIERYSRHLILDEIGVEGQRRLKAGSVLCVGTGGLGAPLLLYLAAAGVGRIGICDFDVVELSNLQRQVIHGQRSIGRRKVVSAKERILDVNPHVEVEIHEERLTSENALRIVGRYDVVVDGTDNFPTRYLVNDACVLSGKPNVYGSIFRFEGQASVFNWKGGPNYRDLYPEPPPPGLVPSCAEGGVLGVLPGVIGAIQANETLKILLGRGETLSGRLLLYDALRMRFRELKVRKLPGAPPITRLVDYEEMCGIGRGGVGAAAAAAEASAAARPAGGAGGPAALAGGAGLTGGAGALRPAAPFTPLGVRELQARWAEGWRPYILDVRGPAEAAIARLPHTDRLQPHLRILDVAADLPADRDIVVYCKAGGRSRFACEALASRGVKRLFNLEGGITAWAREVDRSVPVY